MNNPTEAEIARIQAERAQIFTPDWFRRLLSGRLGVGDTFWLGNYAVLLGVVPLVVLVAGLLYAQAPGAMMPFLRGFALAVALWRLGIVQALWRARSTRRAKGVWPVAGLLWTLGEAVAAARYGLGGE